MFGKPVKASLSFIPSRPRCLLSDDINSGARRCQRLNEDYWLVIDTQRFSGASSLRFAVILRRGADIQVGGNRDYRAGSEWDNVQNLLGRDDPRVTNRVGRQLLQRVKPAIF
jgi:hypothetical protein